MSFEFIIVNRKSQPGRRRTVARAAAGVPCTWQSGWGSVVMVPRGERSRGRRERAAPDPASYRMLLLSGHFLENVLIARGADPSKAHSSHAVDSYSFRTQQWTQLPNTLDPHSFHGAEAVCGAIILLGGMYNDPGSLELWDGARWRRMKLSLPTQLQFFGTALLYPAVSPSSAAAAGGSANLNPI